MPPSKASPSSYQPTLQVTKAAIRCGLIISRRPKKENTVGWPGLTGKGQEATTCSRPPDNINAVRRTGRRVLNEQGGMIADWVERGGQFARPRQPLRSLRVLKQDSSYHTFWLLSTSPRTKGSLKKVVRNRYPDRTSTRQALGLYGGDSKT